MNFSILTGDVVSVLPALEANSFDAALCDPPYGLEFMGKEWDKLGFSGPMGGGTAEHVGDADGTPFRRHTGTPGFASQARGKRCGECRKFAGGNPKMNCRCGNPSFRNVSRGAEQEAFHYGWATTLFRVLKPGAMLLAFGGTRTHHRLMCALEDAGFEIRDTLCWLYGSGFPKSLDISKALDKRRDDEPPARAVGAWLRVQREKAGLKQKEVAANWPSATGGLTGCVANWELGFNVPKWDQWLDLKRIIGFGDEMDAEVWRLNGRKGTPGNERPDRVVGEDGDNEIYQPIRQVLNAGTPITDLAKRWRGYGTALKPAWESCIVAMKPLDGTFANNAQKWGVAGINVDGGRIGTDSTMRPDNQQPFSKGGIRDDNGRPALNRSASGSASGRWPANVMLDETAARQLDEMSGERRTSDQQTAGTPRQRDGGWGNTYDGVVAPSRFFYTAKVSTAEREGSDHPTMKPIDLTRYLAKLILPPQRESPRRIIVPFAGVGSEMIGAILAGWDEVVGIEKDEKYAAKARERIVGTAPLFLTAEA